MIAPALVDLLGVLLMWAPIAMAAIAATAVFFWIAIAWRWGA